MHTKFECRLSVSFSADELKVKSPKFSLHGNVLSLCMAHSVFLGSAKYERAHVTVYF